MSNDAQDIKQSLWVIFLAFFALGFLIAGVALIILGLVPGFVVTVLACWGFVVATGALVGWLRKLVSSDD